MNVLSLFDGMSCGQIALKELGIKPSIYYASEIDKHAIAQTKLNFPNTIQLGSVVDVDVSKLDHIDLLIGGSPCQSFSFAGKRKGMAAKAIPPYVSPTYDDYEAYINDENNAYVYFDDYLEIHEKEYDQYVKKLNIEVVEIYTLDHYLELKQQGFEFEGQSYLFWEYMRILTDIRKYNPNVKFLLENVEMGKKWERVLSEAIGVYGVHINSALVSAQNRKRIYWTNIRTRQHGLFGELHSDIPQPKDEGILLRDILESDVPEKYYLSDKMISWLNKHGDKRGTEMKQLDGSQKASCLTVSANVKQNLSTDYVCVAMRGRNPDNPSDRTTGAPTEQRLEPNTTGKTNCLTSVQKDNLVMQINPSTESNGKQPYQQNRIYDTNGISPALCANKADLLITDWHKKNYKEVDSKANALLACSYKGNQSNGMTLVPSDYRIRRLTPTECARLQTVPGWYKWGCSDTQAYKMLGNGWTIKVIQHILSYL